MYSSEISLSVRFTAKVQSGREKADDAEAEAEAIKNSPLPHHWSVSIFLRNVSGTSGSPEMSLRFFNTMTEFIDALMLTQEGVASVINTKVIEYNEQVRVS